MHVSKNICVFQRLTRCNTFIPRDFVHHRFKQADVDEREMGKSLVAPSWRIGVNTSCNSVHLSREVKARDGLRRRPTQRNSYETRRDETGRELRRSERTGRSLRQSRQSKDEEARLHRSIAAATRPLSRCASIQTPRQLCLWLCWRAAADVSKWLAECHCACVPPSHISLVQMLFFFLLTPPQQLYRVQRL